MNETSIREAHRTLIALVTAQLAGDLPAIGAEWPRTPTEMESLALAGLGTVVSMIRSTATKSGLDPQELWRVSCYSQAASGDL